MSKKHVVKLKKRERDELLRMTRQGTEKARKLRRCQILLLSHNGKNDSEIRETLNVSLGTIANIRKRYLKEGLQAALCEKRRSGAPRKFKGREAAKITALACSTPPEGHGRWTLELLADRAVKLELVNEISHMSVHRILKKTNSNRISKSNGVLEK